MQNLAQYRTAIIMLGPFLDSDGIPITTLTSADLDSLDFFKPNSTVPIDIKHRNIDHKSNGVYRLLIPGEYTDEAGSASIYASKNDVFIQTYIQFNIMIATEYDYRYTSIAKEFEATDGIVKYDDDVDIKIYEGEWIDGHTVWAPDNTEYIARLRPANGGSYSSDRGYFATKIKFRGDPGSLKVKTHTGIMSLDLSGGVTVDYREYDVDYDCVFYDKYGPYVELTTNGHGQMPQDETWYYYVNYMNVEVGHIDLPDEHELALRDINKNVEYSAVASAVWNAELEYKDTDGITKTNKAWLMMQSLFSVFKQKMKELI